MAFGPRYDLAQGVLLLVAVSLLLAGFGVPSGPSLLTLSFVALALAGLLALAASRRPAIEVAGRRVDYLTLRGTSGCLVGTALVLSGVTLSLDGDPFGLLVVVSGLFVVGTGIGVLLRRPTFVPELRTA
ncbi:hypothetical protein [Halomarina pelagica]|uniref:hypothetical protein n=1 Tax=Halomarina pelagica TaxID=2961599 RepID=UPI0020C4A0BA|nr:hypothetical protein [Halomarina sp. BND7]